MTSSICDPIDFKHWDESLCLLPDYSFFHLSAWAQVLRNSYAYRPVYFAIMDQSVIKAVIPCMEVNSAITGKRGVSLPFTDYCEPIAADDFQFQDMFQTIQSFGKKRRWKYLEFRGGEKFFPREVLSERYYGHILDLTPGTKRLFAGLRDSTRRNIRKAEKLKIEITISTAPDALMNFCRLNVLTRREHGLPPQSSKFFDYVYEYIISRNLGFVVLATFEKRVVAANVYFHAGDKVIYKYGASDKSFQELRANNLVMWNSIEWSCNHGFKSFSFGRTELENEGLRQFKNGWGTREYFINYYKYDLQKGAFVQDSRTINPLFKKIIRKLPVPVLKMMGNILYRHMG